MRWIGVEMANLPSSTALNKGLKPLAPTIWQRKNRCFGDLMTAPRTLGYEILNFGHLASFWKIFTNFTVMIINRYLTFVMILVDVLKKIYL